MYRLLLILLSLAIAIPFTASADDRKPKVQNVRVINLPETQKIDGTIEIKGFRNSFLDRREKIIISPVNRSNTTNLADLGVVQAEGFTSLILSLQGEVQGKSFTSGTVGAVLIPDEKPIIRAFTQDQAILFPLEVKTDVTPGANRYFSSKPTKQMIGFPRYRVFLYNSTDMSVEANLYIYLIN